MKVAVIPTVHVKNAVSFDYSAYNSCEITYFSCSLSDTKINYKI